MTSTGSANAKLAEERIRLSSVSSYNHYLTLLRPAPRVFEVIGLYSQLSATTDLHLRRIYFALRAKGDNQRGPERAHLDQILDRLPAVIERCDIALYRKEEFPELLAVLRRLMVPRNDVIHSACRWQPDGDLLVFAHANETVGRDITTGEGIAYWIVPQASFFALVQELEIMCAYITQYSATWLPKLRPWLQTYWDGAPDPDSARTDAFFAKFSGKPE